VETLEDRLTPTTTINVGSTTADLIAAIDQADHTQGPVVLNLPLHTIYTLTAPVSTSAPPNQTLIDNAFSTVENYDWYGPNGLPAIDNDITINGNGSVIERGNLFFGPAVPDFRLFYVSGGYSGLPLGKLTLKDLTLGGGIAEGGDGGPGGGGGLGAGGAIFNQGTLTLNRVTLAFNQAIGGNGGEADYNPGGFEGIGGGGGGGMGSSADSFGDGGGFGLFPNGLFGGLGGPGSYSQNDGIGFGGGGGGFRPGDNGNWAGSGSGGGLGGFGGINVNNGAIPDDGGSGGTSLDAGGAGGNFGFGGAAIPTESGGGGGGGGGGASGDTEDPAEFIGGGGGFGGGGGAYGGGGGFGGGGSGWGAVGGFGGGDGGADVILPPLHDDEYPYDYFGGGGGGAGLGGAIFTMGDVGILSGCGLVSMTDCTLTANLAQGGNGGDGGNDGATGGTGGSGLGGAIFNLDGLASLADCTVDGNTVVAGHGGVRGGDIWAQAPDGAIGGGAVYNLAYGNFIPTGGPTGSELALFNSILANSSGGGDLVSVAGNGNGINQATVTGNTNLVQSNIPIIGSHIEPGVITIKGVSPNLGPLQYNGGPTPTMALGLFSPAFGTGNPNVSGLPQKDQRGKPRLDAGQLDLGAYEFQGRALVFGGIGLLQGAASSHSEPPGGQPPSLLPGAMTGNNFVLGLDRMIADAFSASAGAGSAALSVLPPTDNTSPLCREEFPLTRLRWKEGSGATDRWPAGWTRPGTPPSRSSL